MPYPYLFNLVWLLYRYTDANICYIYQIITNKPSFPEILNLLIFKTAR